MWQAGRRRRRAGLPSGRVIYSDTRLWGKVDAPLYYAPLQLTGKPDYIVRHGEGIVPVEVKSGRAPAAPYDSHVYQLAAYCLLIEKIYGKRPAFGIVHYSDKDFAIDYTAELEASLLRLLEEMRQDESSADVARSHDQARRCARCGFRNVCDQSLA